MRYIIDNEKYGQRTEFETLDEIRDAARELAHDWDCDPAELTEEMLIEAIPTGL